MKNLFALILLFVTVTLAECPRRTLARSKWPFRSDLFGTMYPGCLSKEENSLIKNYKVVYYVGQNVPESSARMSYQEPLSIVPHDHFDFRYEIISALRTTDNIYLLKALDHKHKADVLLKVSRTKKGKAAIKAQVEKQNDLVKRGKADWFVHFSNAFEYRGTNVVSYQALEYRSLSSYISQSLPLAKVLVRDLVGLFKHIKELSVPHCEIRSDNIVLRTAGEFVLTEFGSCDLPSSSVFSAPEVGSGDVGSKADVYSFGMILADILTGGKVENLAQQASRRKPRTDADYSNELLELIEQNLVFDTAENSLLQAALEAIRKCLKHEPSQRLSLQELLESLLLNGALKADDILPHLELSERKLVKEFDEIYYYGQNRPRSALRSNYNRNELALHDHLAFRYEILPASMNRKILGSGSFGKVYKALDHKSGKEVALKTAVQSNAEFLKEEYDIMKSIHGKDFGPEMNAMKKYVMKPLDLFEYRGMTVMVIPLMKGSLLDDLKSRPTYISYERFRLLARQILLGMMLIEKAGYVHCDLKSENILLSATDDPVISDFGVCLNVESCRRGNRRGTPGLMAPEVCRKSPFDSKADVYSYGVMMARIFINRNDLAGPQMSNFEAILQEKGIFVSRNDPAVPDMSIYEAILRKIENGKAITMTETQATNALAFIGRCIQPTAVNRPAISELLHDQFFSGMRL